MTRFFQNRKKWLCRWSKIRATNFNNNLKCFFLKMEKILHLNYYLTLLVKCSKSLIPIWKIRKVCLKDKNPSQTLPPVPQQKFINYATKNRNSLLIQYIWFPEAEFSVSICSTPKFIWSSDDCVPRLLITENDISYKSNIYKSRMMWTLYYIKIVFWVNIYLKVKGK